MHSSKISPERIKTPESTNQEISTKSCLESKGDIIKFSKAKTRRLRRKQALNRLFNINTNNTVVSTNSNEVKNVITTCSTILGHIPPVSNVHDKSVSLSRIEHPTLDDIIHEDMSEKIVPNPKMEQKTREEIKAEREAKKLMKQQAKNKKAKTGDESKSEDVKRELKNTTVVDIPKETVDIKVKSFAPSKDEVDRALHKIVPSEIKEIKPEKSKSELKAERRAKQEAQRAAKSLTSTKNNDQNIKTAKSDIVETRKVPKPTETSIKKKIVKQPQNHHKVKLFNHLYTEREANVHYVLLNSLSVHPAIVQLGAQYSTGVITGSNARCIAFLNALKIVIKDYVTPPQREFSRELESCLKPCMDYLHQCRPVSVSMINALRFIKRQISQLPTNIADSDAKLRLQESIDTYYVEQIRTAAKAISSFVQNKIVDGDIILTFGCSSLIQTILEDAMKNRIDFRVIVVDGRPSLEGREMLRRLVDRGIACSYIFINAVSFIMGEVTKVLLGAHALLANGYVMSRVGTAQIAMVAQSFNVPVLVCCETHKFIERVQTDSFVYNEIGDPEMLVSNSEKGPLSGWINIPTLSPLNLRYDVTPPELVTAVVTELAILPCTSVPVILRIKPTDISC